MSLPAESLKLTAVFCWSGSRGLRNTAALTLFAIESHSSSQGAQPGQPLELTVWPAYVGHDNMTTDHSRFDSHAPDALPFGLPAYVAPLPAASVSPAPLGLSSLGA